MLLKTDIMIRFAGKSVHILQDGRSLADILGVSNNETEVASLK